MINSPDFEAAKFWVGNLGKTATHAVVYAQLYTPDQVCHGLHSFVVPVSSGEFEYLLKKWLLASQGTRQLSESPRAFVLSGSY